MPKSYDYKVKLYPAHKDGGFVVTTFEICGEYPEHLITAAGMGDLVDQITHIAMDHAEGCCASAQCLAPRKPPGFKAATEGLYFNLREKAA